MLRGELIRLCSYITLDAHVKDSLLLQKRHMNIGLCVVHDFRMVIVFLSRRLEMDRTEIGDEHDRSVSVFVDEWAGKNVWCAVPSHASCLQCLHSQKFVPQHNEHLQFSTTHHYNGFTTLHTLCSRSPRPLSALGPKMFPPPPPTHSIRTRQTQVSQT